MKKLLVLAAICVMAGAIMAGEMTTVEWSQYRDALGVQLDEHARLVESGQAEPIKCATPMFLALFNSQPAEVAYKPAFTDREDTMSFTHGTTHFLLHYTSTGTNRVYQYDVQSITPGIPDYIVESGNIMESVYDRYMTALGYDAPVSDGWYNGGGDGRIDIYFINFGAYGATVRDSFVTPFTATSYMFLENDYQGFPGYETNRLNALRVTAAHEFFHVIQFGYDIAEVELTPVPGDVNASWIEMSATYMEEYHYDQINDYYGYLPYFYDFPHYSLQFGSYQGGTYLNRNFHMYGAIVWPLFLVEQFDADIIKNIWDSCKAIPGPNWVDATDEIIGLRSGGSESLASMFEEFALWNLFTYNRARTGEYFPEATNYDPVYYVDEISSYPATVEVRDTLFPDNLGANYIRLFNLSSQTSGLQVNFLPSAGYDWSLHVVGLPSNVATGPVSITTYDETTSSIPIPNASSFSQIILIPSVLSSEDSTVSYSISITGLGSGVTQPNGGEVVYAGTDYSVSWYFNPDSVLVVDIELSIDGGATWTPIATVPNVPSTYQWTVPATPSTNCLMRVTDADDPTTTDVSNGVFSILVTGESAVLNPFPNPAWVQSHDSVTFSCVLGTGGGPQEMTVQILNLAGEKVKELGPVSGAGALSLGWDFTNIDGETVAAGAYLAVITFAGETEVKKFMVLR